MGFFQVKTTQIQPFGGGGGGSWALLGLCVNVALFVKYIVKRAGIQDRLTGLCIWKQNGEVSLSNKFQLLPLWFPE